MSCFYGACQKHPVALCKKCDNMTLVCKDHLLNHSESRDHFDYEDIKNNLDFLLKRHFKIKQKAIINEIIKEHQNMISHIKYLHNFTIQEVKKISLDFKNPSEFDLKNEEMQSKIVKLVQIYDDIKRKLNHFINNYNNEENFRSFHQMIQNGREERLINIRNNNEEVKVTNENTVQEKEVIFISTIKILPGSDVYLTGSCSELGNWDSNNLIKLDWINCMWVKKINFKSNDIEYKYLIKIPNGNILWETGNNHKVEFDNCVSFVSYFEEFYEIKTEIIKRGGLFGGLFSSEKQHKVNCEYRSYTLSLN